MSIQDLLFNILGFTGFWMMVVVSVVLVMRGFVIIIVWICLCLGGFFGCCFCWVFVVGGGSVWVFGGFWYCCFFKVPE